MAVGETTAFQSVRAAVKLKPSVVVLRKQLSIFLGRVSMYRLMLVYLLGLVTAAIVLSTLTLLPFKPLDIFFSGAFLVVVCIFSNKIFAAFFKTRPNLESRSITALILTLIIGPVPLFQNFGFLTLAGAAAMASKYLLVIKRRHIFNPAAFGVLATALVLGQGASWWVGNKFLVPFVILGGLIMLRKIHRFHLLFSFLIPYLAVSTLLGTPLKNLLLFSPLLFFSLVMLPEPLTAPQEKNLRVAYGIFIAFALVFFQKFFPSLPYSLELSLLGGNLLTRLLYPDPRVKATLTIKQKLDTNIFGFWFEPEKTFSFLPGQFLEWTLPHPHPDSRGFRRYFTIASSPTESKLLLATRIGGDRNSSYKNALNNIKAGDEIIISNREGEFTLPKDAKIPLAFIAGGIGITPFRSIIKYLLDAKQKRDIVLLYSNRSAADIVFREIFEEASEKFSLKTVYVNTDTLEGYIDPPLIKYHVPDWPKRLFYISGPEPMVLAFAKMLDQMGVKRQNLKRDYFPGYTETHQA